MAIAFLAGTSGSVVASSSITVSHTVSGADVALVVAATCPNSADYLAGATVTFNGVSMGAPRIAANDGGASLFTYIWVLVAPASGAHDVVITPTEDAYLCVVVASFSGVDQTTPVAASSAESAVFATSPRTLTMATPAGGMAFDAFSLRTLDGTITPGADQTTVTAAVDDSVGRLQCSYEADETSMFWSFSTSEPTIAYAALALNPASGGGGGGIDGDAAITLDGDTVSASGTVSGGSSAAFTVGPLRDNFRNLRADQTGVTVDIYDATTRALIVRETGLTTNASGMMTVSSASMVAATAYRFNVVFADGVECLPVATAA